jgi:hypothetical protein
MRDTEKLRQVSRPKYPPRLGRGRHGSTGHGKHGILFVVHERETGHAFCLECGVRLKGRDLRMNLSSRLRRWAQELVGRCDISWVEKEETCRPT